MADGLNASDKVPGCLFGGSWGEKFVWEESVEGCSVLMSVMTISCCGGEKSNKGVKVGEALVVGEATLVVVLIVVLVVVLVVLVVVLVGVWKMSSLTACASGEVS
jgi:hypothetical protein